MAAPYRRAALCVPGAPHRRIRRFRFSVSALASACLSVAPLPASVSGVPCKSAKLGELDDAWPVGSCGATAAVLCEWFQLPPDADPTAKSTGPTGSAVCEARVGNAPMPNTTMPSATVTTTTTAITPCGTRELPTALRWRGRGCSLVRNRLAGGLAGGMLKSVAIVVLINIYG